MGEPKIILIGGILRPSAMMSFRDFTFNNVGYSDSYRQKSSG
jgi:hypothetical protein